MNPACRMCRFVLPLLLLLAGMSALAQQGITRTNVVLGQSVALTGAASALAAPFHQGAKLYFDRVNAAGGVNGRRIELVTLDDRGDVQNTVANTRALLNKGVFALFGYYGSPQVMAAYPLIKESDVLLFAPMAAADELRGALYENVYSIRPGYSEEAAAIARHAEALGARRLAIVHATDHESLAALDGATRTMTAMGSNLVSSVELKKKAGGQSPIDKVLAARPESILVIGTATEAAQAVRLLRANGFRGTVYGFSNTGESLLADELGSAGGGVVIVRVVPKSDALKIPVVRDLIADASAAKAGKPNVYMLEGYLAARSFCEALQQITKEPTRVRLKKVLMALEDRDLGGFRLNFTGDRGGSRLVELGMIDSSGRMRD